jgi:hypothetical protein
LDWVRLLENLRLNNVAIGADYPRVKGSRRRQGFAEIIQR